jgi:hypothetical protein
MSASGIPDDRLSAGPLRAADPSVYQERLAMIDPALDACCRRDAEDAVRAQAKREVLRRHDPVENGQRSRRLKGKREALLSPPPAANRNLVTVLQSSYGARFGSFEGCRCCYDPAADGGEDYPALAELRNVSQREAGRDEEPEEERRSSSSAGSDEEKGASGDGDDELDSDEELDKFLEGFEDEPEAEQEAAPPAGASASAAAAGALSEWERRRRLELERQARERRSERHHGRGAHRYHHPSRVLQVAGMFAKAEATGSGSGSRRQPGGARRSPPARCVVHLYDPQSLASASLDLFLERELAPRMRGTLFVRSEGRAALRLHLDRLLRLLGSPDGLRDSADGGRSLSDLVERFRNNSSGPRSALPALLALREGRVVSAAAGYDAQWVDPSTGAVVEEEVVRWLDRSGALDADPPRPDELCQLRPEKLALLDIEGVPAGDEASFYECGLDGCRKPYAHQHVGIGGAGAAFEAPGAAGATEAASAP